MDYVRVIWPIASTLTPILIGLAVLWLRNQFALKTELAALATEVARHNAVQDKELAGHETRIVLLEKECASPPTRHEINDKLGKVSERLSSVERGVDGVSIQLGTQNDYLRALLTEGAAR
ncbi:hypothetical protein I6G65_16050 [Sphingomonas paucimobilis]|nr:hypothetical protein [Sphingomonas paucimobilis]QPS15802.1 hypothetical protein I6G65_16050 [Sphingomonas paucimobilis]SUJ08283.1 Uncharacterised protein [Sphingomonas paucimobilis]